MEPSRDEILIRDSVYMHRIVAIVGYLEISPGTCDNFHSLNSCGSHVN